MKCNCASNVAEANIKTRQNIAQANIRLEKNYITISINRAPDSPLISELRAEIEALEKIGKSFADIDKHIADVIAAGGYLRKKYITQEGYDGLPEKNENILYIIV